jgi:hypothetical protein
VHAKKVTLMLPTTADQDAAVKDCVRYNHSPGMCISHGLVSVVSFLKSCAWDEVSRSTNEEPIKFLSEEAN